jgi:hypothetical protein
MNNMYILIKQDGEEAQVGMSDNGRRSKMGEFLKVIYLMPLMYRILNRY